LNYVTFEHFPNLSYSASEVANSVAFLIVAKLVRSFEWENTHRVAG